MVAIPDRPKTQPSPALLDLVRQAHAAGMPADQVRRFLDAQAVPLPWSLPFHAAARAADHEGAADEIAIGGARGPGKTHASFTQVAVDDCQRRNELVFLYLRKVGKAARESLERLTQKLLKTIPYRPNWQTGSILFAETGSRIIVGNFQNESDIDKYLGLEFDGIAIEEGTQLSESKIVQIRGSLRTSRPDWRPRIYYTTNPGGVGHQWFRKKFVQPWRRGEELFTRFFPASYKDNPFLDAGYIRYLESLTGVLGRMWRDGDWDVGAGQFFTNWDYKKHVLKPFDIPQHWPVWASLDYGFSHPTAVYWHAANGNTIYTVAEHSAPRWLVQQHAARIKEISAETSHLRRPVHQLQAFVAGHDCFANRGDRQGKTIAQQYAEHGIKLTKANINRIGGAAEMLARLGNDEAGIEPSWYIFDNCPRLIETIPAMLSDPNRAEDVLKVDADIEGEGGDDSYDSARYGIMYGASLRPRDNARSHSVKR